MDEKKEQNVRKAKKADHSVPVEPKRKETMESFLARFDKEKV